MTCLSLRLSQADIDHTGYTSIHYHNKDFANGGVGVCDCAGSKCFH